MKRAFLFAVGLATLLAFANSRAAGLIIVDDPELIHRPPPSFPGPDPRPFPPPRPLPPPRHFAFAPLETVSSQVNVRITDQIAVTSVDQEFHNPNARQLEGTFLFPVPKGVQIDKFSMDIDGKQVEAELLAADKARGIYEDIVRRMRDPALLEYAGRDLFKVRIFPIEPNSRKRVKLSYTEVLKADAGLVSYIHPLNTEKYSAKPIRNLSLKVELSSRRPLKSIYSPTHKVEIRRDGERSATVGFEATDTRPDTDFQLLFQPEEGEVGLSLLTHRTGDEDGYFLLFAAPGFERRGAKILEKDVAFVLDTSGSMAGNKLEQAKKALRFCVENLNDGDRFEVIRFSTEVEPLFENLVPAIRNNRVRAADFIQDLRPIGGTAIDEALRRAMRLRTAGADRPFVVIFLTDGRPTIGATDPDQILAGVRQSAGSNIRVFCFGIGGDVNTHLLDRITEETRAFSQYVLPEEDLELKVSSFFTKIKEPVLANVHIRFPDGVRATKLYPSPLPDLFQGEQLILAGRYAGAAKGRLTIEGDVNEAHRALGVDVEFPAGGSDHDFIPRLWATRRVGFLLDEIRLHGDNKELREEVTELARRYGIVTPYTAYLIVEDETRRGLPVSQQTLPQRNDDRFAARYGAPVFESFRKDQSGDAAVAAARASMALKSAETATGGIATGNEEARRQLYALQPPAQTVAPASGGRPAATPRALTAGAAPAPTALQPQARYVQGHTFYLNDDQWIDARVQNLPNAQRIRIAFGSQEYFDLLASHPETAQWLALGRNVQFALGNTIYEIHGEPASP